MIECCNLKKKNQPETGIPVDIDSDCRELAEWVGLGWVGWLMVKASAQKADNLIYTVTSPIERKDILSGVTRLIWSIIPVCLNAQPTGKCLSTAKTRFTKETCYVHRIYVPLSIIHGEKGYIGILRFSAFSNRNPL